jgi:hypothetical protein
VRGLYLQNAMQISTCKELKRKEEMGKRGRRGGAVLSEPIDRVER